MSIVEGGSEIATKDLPLRIKINHKIHTRDRLWLYARFSQDNSLLDMAMLSGQFQLFELKFPSNPFRISRMMI